MGTKANLKDETQNYLQGGVVEGMFVGYRTDFEIKFDEPFWETPKSVVASVYFETYANATLNLLLPTLTNEGVKGRLERSQLNLKTMPFSVHWMAIGM